MVKYDGDTRTVGLLVFQNNSGLIIYDYFKARKLQTLEGCFSQLCTCLACRATNSC